MKPTKCRMIPQSTPVVRKAGELLTRYLAERRGIIIKWVDGPAHLTFDIRPGIGGEGFRIEDGADGVLCLTGNDERGLLYAVGKYLREPDWRGTTVPEKKFRAIYFATHFHNYYHDAPVDEVRRYVEELALWGCNTLMVWFDMHHYSGIQDPAAQAMIRRLHDILLSAQECGMTIGLCALANESFSDSPPELRADWTAGHDGYTSELCGHYHVEICPNKPGGLDLILEYRRQMLRQFSDLDIGILSVGPYDQGGCTCTQCAPWGANGFLKTAKSVAGLMREFFPKAATILVTWYLDKFTTGEWEGLDRAFANRPDWVDYLLIDNHGAFPEYPLKHGVPGGLPAVSFPEISMMHMWPWGGFGANPRPKYWQEYWEQVHARLAGSLPYSEGIYEDINKVIHLQLNWSTRRHVRDIVREYAASEFSPACAGDIVRITELLESAQYHSVDHGAALAVMEAGGWEMLKDRLPRIYQLPRVKDPAPCFELVRQVESRLSPFARKSWRWRVIRLRAALDMELHASKGRPTDRSDTYFEDLNKIYHSDMAEWIVSPVGTKSLTRLRPGLNRSARRPRIAPSLRYSKFVTTWLVSKLMPKSVAAAPVVSLTDPIEWHPVYTTPAIPGFANVHALFGNQDGIAYLAKRFRVRKAGKWILHIGHDGGVRVFVNGRTLITEPTLINPAPVFRSRASIALGKGVNEIVVAFDTAGGCGWGIFCCFERVGKLAGRGAFPQPVPVKKS